MKEGYTHITVILDKSGSMDTIKEDTIGGFNSFLKGQKKTANDGDTFTLIQFSTGDTATYVNARIHDVVELSDKNYHPMGGTALLDAIGNGIKSLGSHLNSLKEEQRPAKVIFVILTDGEENSSRSFNKAQINQMIKEQSEVYKWEFVFLGANQDAIQAGSSLGIAMTNSMSYGANKAGVTATFDSLTRSLNTYKTSAVGLNYAESGAAFTVAERSASMGGAAPVDLSKVAGTVDTLFVARPKDADTVLANVSLAATGTGN